MPSMNKKVLNWLLEENNPSIRYFTLIDLLDYPETNSKVRQTKILISGSKITRMILSKLQTAGFWEDRDSPYLPKYKASYWQIMILGYLGMYRSNPKVRKACNFIFKFQHPEGGFSTETAKTAKIAYDYYKKKKKSLPSVGEWTRRYIYEGQLSCLTGNITAALIRLGYYDDPRVKKALNWLVQIQNLDGGWLCPYWRAHIRDTHSCFYGTIGPLEAFSVYPKRRWTKRMRDSVHRAAEFVLMHRLYKADHHRFRIINRHWLDFSFPWFYNYNILRGLDILGRLGYIGDSRLDDALRILLKKRKNDGRWFLDNTPSGRMHANIEKKGRPSKWITLTALRILKRRGRAGRFGVGSKHYNN